MPRLFISTIPTSEGFRAVTTIGDVEQRLVSIATLRLLVSSAITAGMLCVRELPHYPIYLCHTMDPGNREVTMLKRPISHILFLAHCDVIEQPAKTDTL